MVLNIAMRYMVISLTLDVADIDIFKTTRCHLVLIKNFNRAETMSDSTNNKTSI